MYMYICNIMLLRDARFWLFVRFWLFAHLFDLSKMNYFIFHLWKKKMQSSFESLWLLKRLNSDYIWQKTDMKIINIPS